MGNSVHHTGFFPGTRSKGQMTMAKFFTTLLGRIRSVDSTAEHARPPRRGFEIAVHPATPRRSEERPQTGSRGPRHR